MPAADYQLFVIDMRAVAQHGTGAAVGRLLNSFDSADRDQALRGVCARTVP